MSDLQHRAAIAKAEGLTFDTEPCYYCGGHGIYDAGYHEPRECKKCNGSGRLRLISETGDSADV